ncbi:hypothetical protein [Kitasatospora sp. NPDC098663]|uniref:hypothetical protein n=1 Tax=Kitasatospora sp. NPDC098663 TaxID=3364096 RepID=UPI003815E4DA
MTSRRDRPVAARALDIAPPIDRTPSVTASPYAAGPRLLERLAAPLRRAGWATGESWCESDEADDNPEIVPGTTELSRSNFHISVHWDPATA